MYIKIFLFLTFLTGNNMLASNITNEPFKFVTYNIDTNASKTEDGFAIKSHAKWRIKARLPGIMNTLSKIDGDIVNIQEARKFINKMKEEVDPLTPMMNYFQEKGFEVIEAGYSPAETAYHFITAFKKERFQLIENEIRYLTKTLKPITRDNLKDKSKEEIKEHNYGEDLERSILALKLFDKINNKILYILNIHMGLSKLNRLKGSELIIDFIKELLLKEPKSSILMAGDFNSFPDDGGPEQIEKLLNTSISENAFLTELSDELYLPDEITRMPYDMTFIPFPYDFGPKNQEFIKDGTIGKINEIVDPEDRKKKISEVFSKCPLPNSKLDHIFVHGLSKIGKTIISVSPTTTPYPVEYNDDTLKDYILNICKDGPAFWSDHQPLVVRINYKYPLKI